MGFISALDPASHTAIVFTDTLSLSNAIDTHHVTPLRPTGEPFTLQRFEGGWLLDGAPINVYIDGYWYQGQQELLAPYWQQGTIPMPPQNVLAEAERPLPSSVAWQYFADVAKPEAVQTIVAATPQLQQLAQQAMAQKNAPNWLLWGGLAVAAYLLFR